MWSGIKSLINMSDFISEKPQILLNKSERSKTVYGGTISLISIILISVALIKFGYEMVTRANSTLTYNKTPVENTSFNYGQFPFMVALLDNGLKLIDNEDRYYYFLADIWNFSPDNSTGQVVMNLNRVPVKTEKCDINKHFGNYTDYFKNVPYLTHHYCAVPGQNITLFGIYGSIQPYNFLDFWISTCVNDTSVNRTNCYSREASQARLVNTYISYQHLDFFIDHKNITDPGQLILRSEILPVSSTIYKRDFFYIRNVDYYTDLDFLFSTSNGQTYSMVSDYKETADLRPQGTVPGSFALISIMMDNSVDQYNRRFTKFQELLANIGGLFKGICIIAYFINYILFDELYYINLISGIFKPEEEEKKNLRESLEVININKSLKNIKETSNVGVGNSMVNLFNKKNNLKTITHNLSPKGPSNNINFAQINKEKSQQSIINNNISLPIKNNNFSVELKKIDNTPNNLRMTFCELVCARFRKSTGKYKTYNLAKEYTQKNLCIQSILGKLSEVNKLKCFAFNTEQMLIFNSIKTPSYHNLNLDTLDIWEDLILTSSKQTMKEMNAIQTFKNKEVYSEMDQNFLNVMNTFDI